MLVKNRKCWHRSLQTFLAKETRQEKATESSQSREQKP